MLKLWGRANSSNVKKVLWACAEMGLPLERIDAGREFGLVDTPAFRVMNPMGLVPVIEDHGFILWESNAILRYLAARYGQDPFYPTDLQVRASADRWMEWQSTTMSPTIGPVFRNLIRKPEQEWDRAQLAQLTRRCTELWAIVDRELAQSPWLAGEHFTIGDIPLGILVNTWVQLPLERIGCQDERKALPHLERWFNALQARPAYRSIVQIPLT